MQLNKYRRLLTIAQAGLFYAKDEFDKERYTEIKEISLNLINEKKYRCRCSAFLYFFLFPRSKTFRFYNKNERNSGSFIEISKEKAVF